MNAPRACTFACVVVVIGAACRKDSESEKVTDDTAAAVERPGPGEWTPRIYAALGEEVSRGCERSSLPRLGSGPFDDLMDSRNLDAFDQPELPRDQRIARLGEMFGALNSLAKAHLRCGRSAEMLAVMTLALEVVERIIPEMEGPEWKDSRAEVLAGLTTMLTGIFNMLKVADFEMATVEPFAARLGSAAGITGGFLPQDWLRVQLDSLRGAAAATKDPKHRAVLELVVAAAERE